MHITLKDTVLKVFGLDGSFKSYSTETVLSALFGVAENDVKIVHGSFGS